MYVEIPMNDKKDVKKLMIKLKHNSDRAVSLFDNVLTFPPPRSFFNFYFKVLTLCLSTLLLAGCGGSQERPCARTEGACVIVEPPPVEIWWDAPIPDFSENADRPTISLLGDRTKILELGEFYLEDGAIAEDEQDGDLTSDIIVVGEVNTDQIGDYLIRYQVKDSSDNNALEQVRIVRVINDKASKQTRRPLGTTMSNFGYLEHLPVDYGQSSAPKPPLIIYLHGSGANLQNHDNNDPISSLDVILNNDGIPTMIDEEQWDNDLPFVVLTPHLGSIPNTSYSERLDAFVNYATHSYDIDTDRVYMVGWSAGGYLSLNYTIDYPNKIAALVPMASGLSTNIDELPSNFCDIETVPVWLFHGSSDQIVSQAHSISTYNAILDMCQAVTLPKLMLFLEAQHHIHRAIFDLSVLAGGSIEIDYDPRFDPYDVGIYEWLLAHSLEERF